MYMYISVRYFFCVSFKIIMNYKNVFTKMVEEGTASSASGIYGPCYFEIIIISKKKIPTPFTSNAWCAAKDRSQSISLLLGLTSYISRIVLTIYNYNKKTFGRVFNFSMLETQTCHFVFSLNGFSQ